MAFSSRKVWQKGFDIWQETKELMNEQDIDFVESGGLTEQGVSEFLSSSHVVLVPARVDTFGLSIVEAAMCKSIPVVSSLLAHRALGLPLFYADTAECCVRRILEVKEMWEHDCYDAYADIIVPSSPAV